MKTIRKLFVSGIIFSLLLSGCGKEKSTGEAWKTMRYYFDMLGSTELEHPVEHPQLKRELNMQVCFYILELPDDAKKEDIAKLAMALCQTNLDRYFEGNPENREHTMGINLDIYQYGEAIAENVLLLLDKDGKYLEIFQRDSSNGKKGRFISVEEFAGTLEGEGVK